MEGVRADGRRCRAPAETLTAPYEHSLPGAREGVRRKAEGGREEGEKEGGTEGGREGRR